MFCSSCHSIICFGIVSNLVLTVARYAFEKG